MSRVKAPAATSEKRTVKPHTPSRACRAARRRPVASPRWVPAKRSQKNTTVSAGSMVRPPSSTALPRPRREQRDHVLHGLGIDRVALRESTDGGIDGGEERAQAFEPALDE